MENQTKINIALAIFLILALSIGVYSNVNNNSNEAIVEQPVEVCSDVAHGVCLDQDSVYYRCDMINKECNKDIYLEAICLN